MSITTVAGGFCPSATPVPSGPRKDGQLSGAAAVRPAAAAGAAGLTTGSLNR